MMNSPNRSTAQPQPPKSPWTFGDVTGFFGFVQHLVPWGSQEAGAGGLCATARWLMVNGYYGHGLGKKAMAGFAAPSSATPLWLFLCSRDVGSACILSAPTGCDPMGLGHPCHWSPAPSCWDSGLVSDTVITQHPCLPGHETPAALVLAPCHQYGKVGCTSAGQLGPMKHLQWRLQPLAQACFRRAQSHTSLIFIFTAFCGTWEPAQARHATCVPGKGKPVPHTEPAPSPRRAIRHFSGQCSATGEFVR